MTNEDQLDSILSSMRAILRVRTLSPILTQSAIIDALGPKP
jgi:hypothetical protein